MIINSLELIFKVKVMINNGRQKVTIMCNHLWLAMKTVKPPPLIYWSSLVWKTILIILSTFSHRLINKLAPNSVRKINQSALNWHQVSQTRAWLIFWLLFVQMFPLSLLSRALGFVSQAGCHVTVSCRLTVGPACVFWLLSSLLMKLVSIMRGVTTVHAFPHLGLAECFYSIRTAFS